MAESLRERKKLKTRDAVVRAACELFAEKGYTATTVEDITTLAETSSSTFFRYFGSKEEVIFFDFGEQLPRLLDAVRSRAAGTSVWSATQQAFVEAAERFVERHEEFAIDRARLMYQVPELEFRGARLAVAYRDAIAAELGAEADVDGATDLRCQVGAGALVVAWQTAIRLHTVAGGDLRDRVVEAMQVLDRGLVEG